MLKLMHRRSTVVEILTIQNVFTFQFNSSNSKCEQSTTRSETVVAKAKGSLDKFDKTGEQESLSR